MDIVKRKHWVYDCDTCGYNRYHFIVRQNGEDKLLTIYHDWWWENWEDSEERYVYNDFYFEYGPVNGIVYPTENRDWLKP